MLVGLRRNLSGHRFLDMALSALNPAPDERCRVLATDGQTLYYQPQRLLQRPIQEDEISQPVVSSHHIPLRIPAFVAERPPRAAAVEPCV